jgi:hypothetical protein
MKIKEANSLTSSNSKFGNMESIKEEEMLVQIREQTKESEKVDESRLDWKIITKEY